MKDKIITIIRSYGLMSVAMGIAFMIMSFVTSELFLDYSPKVRPFLTDYVQVRASTFVSLVFGQKNAKFLSPTNAQPAVITDKYLENISRQVAPGVRAAEVEGYGYTSYTEGKIEWVRYTYTTKAGQKVTIEVPKGMGYVKTQ